jgi:branched-chain amino acid transport system ATP-binding protein
LADSPILRTRDLGLDIGGATIVAGVELEVPSGEFLGIIGPNGAGKTTLFNLLSGLMRPTSGRIELAGRDVTDEPVHKRTQAGLGRTFQISSVFPLLPVLENVRLAVEASRVGEAIERAQWALGRVGLGERGGVVEGSLPHGDKRKLELAMLLAADKDVILLDEPMAGVSAGEVPGLVDVIRSVHMEEGKTVLMVEHHIGVVTGLADRIAVMHHGALLAIDTPQRVMENAEVQEAYLGEPL